MTLPKESLLTNSIISQKKTMAPYVTFHPEGHHVSRCRQVPTLTPHDTLYPDGRHVSRGCQVHKGRQVLLLTQRNTLHPNGFHVLKGHQVPSLTPCDTLRLTVVRYQGVVMYST